MKRNPLFAGIVGLGLIVSACATTPLESPDSASERDGTEQTASALTGSWGRLANPGVGPAAVKTTYFFPGNQPLERDLYTMRSSNPGADYWWTPDGTKLSSAQAEQNRSFAMSRMKATGINTVTAPYLGKNSSQGRGSENTEAAFAGLLDQAKKVGLFVLPALEWSQNCSVPPYDQFGLSADHLNLYYTAPEWFTNGTPDWTYCSGTSSIFDQQGLLTNYAGYRARIAELIQLFKSTSSLAAWAQIYDRFGTARYAIHISHAAQRKSLGHSPGATDERAYADALRALEASIYSDPQLGIHVGFTLDDWYQTETDTNGNPEFLNVLPRCPTTGNDPCASDPRPLLDEAPLLAIQPFLTELKYFDIAKSFACQNPGVVGTQTYTNRWGTQRKRQVDIDNYPAIVKQIADGKKNSAAPRELMA